MCSTTAAAERIAVRRRRVRGWLVLAALLLVGGVGMTLWRVERWPSADVIEYPMLSKTDIPTAVAVAPDGAVWFTIELSDAIGVLRNGRIERLRKGTPNLEPFGLAVDAHGAAWYTDAPAREISRIAPDGTISSFSLSTPIARLGRVAIAPDGAVWFSDATTLSITRLKDGLFTRHDVAVFRASPFGIAVDATGRVWATLQEANKLLQISPGGQLSQFDVPTRGSGLGDVAVDPTGAVWFIEARANKIGRFESGKFTEFAVPTPSAGLTGMATAPDGSVWFTELRSHKLGRLQTGRMTEFGLPRTDIRPFGVAIDAANNVWYTDLGGRLGMLPAARATAH